MSIAATLQTWPKHFWSVGPLKHHGRWMRPPLLPPVIISRSLMLTPRLYLPPFTTSASTSTLETFFVLFQHLFLHLSPLCLSPCYLFFILGIGCQGIFLIVSNCAPSVVRAIGIFYVFLPCCQCLHTLLELRPANSKAVFWSGFTSFNFGKSTGTELIASQLKRY